MAWVTAADLIASWIGDDAPTDTAKVDVWIGRAERMVRRRVPDLEERIEAEELEDPENPSELQQTANDVVIAMVTRVFRNPEGIRQANVTTGPYTESRTYGGDIPGSLVLLEDELADLTGKTSGQTAFTVNLYPPAQTPAGYPDYWDQPDTWRRY